MQNLDPIIKTAKEAVLVGGEMSLEFFQSQLTINTKKDKSLVTKADQEIEQKIVKLIREKHPTHNIYGEESGGVLISDNPTWIIDPIEGTTNFIHSVPIFGSQVAVLINGKIAVSALYDPHTEKQLYSSIGGGAFINEKRVMPKHQSIKASTLLFDTGRDMSMVNAFLKSDIISNFRSFRRLGSLVTDAIFLAENKTSVYLGFNAKVYDFAPSSLFLSEAGYKIFDNSLKTWSPTEVTSLHACHPDEYQKVVKLLKPIFK